MKIIANSFFWMALGIASVHSSKLRGKRGLSQEPEMPDSYKAYWASETSASRGLTGKPDDTPGNGPPDGVPGNPFSNSPEEHLSFHEFYGLSDGSDSLLGGSFLGSLASTILKGVVSGAASKAGGDAYGWALNLVGFNWGNDDMANVQSQLDEQSAMLSDIKNSLNALKDQLAQAVDEILNAITDASDKDQFNAWVASLNSDVGTLLGYSDNLNVMSQLSPSSDHYNDIQNLRSAILINVPGLVRTIDGALMGTGFSEGMISMFARIQWKISANTDDFASTFYSMVDYYRSYQILGLQLMFEAYHATDPPQVDGCDGCVAYYDIWSGLVGKQMEEYKIRSPLGTKANEFDADQTARHKTIGRYRTILPTSDHIYFLNFTGWLHRTDLNGENLQTSNANLYGWTPCQSFLAEDDTAIYAVGCADTNEVYVAVTKYDKATFAKLGRIELPRMPITSPYQTVTAKGIEMDASTNTLYVVQEQAYPMWNTTIQAVDTSSLTYAKAASILIPDQFNPGEMKIINDEYLVFMAVSGTNYEVRVVDRVTGTVVGVLNGASGQFVTSTGESFVSQWASYPNTAHVTARDSSGNLIKRCALGYTGRVTFAAANGLIAYSLGGMSLSDWKMNYTYFDSFQGPHTMEFEDPVTFPYGVDAMAMTENDLVYFSAYNAGHAHTVAYERSYPMEDLPVIASV